MNHILCCSQWTQEIHQWVHEFDFCHFVLFELKLVLQVYTQHTLFSFNPQVTDVVSYRINYNLHAFMDE